MSSILSKDGSIQIDSIHMRVGFRWIETKQNGDGIEKERKKGPVRNAKNAATTKKTFIVED